MQKEGEEFLKSWRRREKEDIRIFRRSDAQKESGDGSRYVRRRYGSDGKCGGNRQPPVRWEDGRQK
ncbi:MAG: hypothetical protein RIB86_21740 [Imperialibacter sp.]